jgi:hypothetical protein
LLVLPLLSPRERSAVVSRGSIDARDKVSSRRDPVVNHSKIIIMALTLTAWWLQLRQYVSGHLVKLRRKASP